MPTIDLDAYDQLLEQIRDNSVVLFLGAGSTRLCKLPDGKRGVVGQELADECLKDLNNNKDPGFQASLTEAAEFYAAWKASARGGLDDFIQKRLTNLQPTLGHYLAASFPWRAVVTTNYNRVAEDAWGTGHAAGYAARELITIRTDEEEATHSGDTSRTRLYKPHGCVTIPDQKKNPMVLTSIDYFESEKKRPKIFTAVKYLSGQCTTLFVGYSMNDYTFRNIYFTLYSQLGQWTKRSYSVTPYDSPKRLQWSARAMDKNFNTTVLDDSFDSFMLRLVRRRGTLHPTLAALVGSRWADVEKDNKAHMDGLAASDFRGLPPS
jgi:hypothetical protein